MAANIFSFRLSEQELIAALATIEHKKKTSTQQFYLEVKTELIADGMGYEILDIHTDIIEEQGEHNDD